MAKMQGIRKQQMVYETKKELDLKDWLAYVKQKSKGMYNATTEKQATEKFNANYPAFKPCPVEGSKLSRCPECGHINTNKKK